MLISCPFLRVILGLRLDTRKSRYEKHVAKMQESTIKDWSLRPPITSLILAGITRLSYYRTRIKVSPS